MNLSLLILGVALVLLDQAIAIPGYVDCAGKYTKGPCVGQGLMTCGGNVMDLPILNVNIGTLLDLGAANIPATMVGGTSLTITFNNEDIRVAYASAGSFSGGVGDACGSQTLLRSETGVGGFGGDGKDIQWTAPNVGGTVELIFIQTNNDAKEQIRRASVSIEVIASDDVVPTSSPTQFIHTVEFQGIVTPSLNLKLGDRIRILSPDNSGDNLGLYLNKFTPGVGNSNPAINAGGGGECDQFSGNLLSDEVAGLTDNYLYDGILGSTFVSDISETTDPFPDLLDGNGLGTYEFVKRECTSGSEPAPCCEVGAPQARLTITLETLAPSAAPTTTPTQSPTTAYEIATIDWKLPYEGPTVIDAQLGDRMTFKILDFSHNIIEIPTKDEFDACDDTNGLIVRDGLFKDVSGVEEEIVYGIEDVGTTRWFVCNRTTNGNNHCLQGQKVAVRISDFTIPELVSWSTADADIAAYAQGMTAKPGSTLQFQYTPGAHSLEQFKTKEAFDACDFSEATQVIDNEFGSGAKVRLSSTEGVTEWFGCSVGSHCAAGQKLAVTLNNDDGDADGLLGPLDPIILLLGLGGGAVAIAALLVGRRFMKRRRVIKDYESGGMGGMGKLGGRSSIGLPKASKRISTGGGYAGAPPTSYNSGFSSTPGRQTATPRPDSDGLRY